MDPSCIVLFIVSLPVVAAFPDDTPYLVADPLEIANLAAHGLFLFTTLVQLAIALSTLFRVQTLRLPAAGAVFALIILTVHHALGIGDVLATSMRLDYPSYHQVFSGIPYMNLLIANNLFSHWVDPAVFVAIAIILHNRYRTVQKSMAGATIAFATIASLLFVIMVVLAAAQQGLYASTAKELLLQNQERPYRFSDTNIRHINTTLHNQLQHAFVAFLILATMFLIVSAFIVNNRIKNDTVTKFMLRAIIPSLLIYALARLLFDIIVTRLPSPRTYNDFIVLYALDFASTLIYGLLYLIVMSVLAFLLLRIWLWVPQPHSTPANVHYPPANPGKTGTPLQLPEENAQVSSQPPPPVPPPLP